MIRLNIKLHKDTLAAYEELETNMKQEREKQLGAINYVSGFWEGQAAKTFQTCYTTMLTEGSYQEVLEQVTGMRTIMEDILPSLKALKWKCDNFDACLSGGKSTGSIFEQYQSTMFLEDVLMLEESVIPRIDSYSDGIMSDINQLESALQDVMQACGELVNFGDESSDLKAACNKVKRIHSLRNEIDDYAKKVIDLDSDLEVSYKAWENAENIDEIEQMKALTEEEKAAVSQLNIFLTVLSWKYDEQEYENIAQLLQTDENGIFEFEKVLQKETLTDEEIEALAHLYEEAYEQIRRTEDCQLSADIVQCYTEKLFYFEEDTKGINQYYVSTKDSLLQSILDKTDTGNEAAIYSLENLKGTKLEVKKSWFESSWKEFGSSVTELKDFKDSTDMIDVALVKTDLGIQTVLYAYPTAGKREEHADEGYKVIYEKELYELPLLDRCARSGYIMTKEEEKQVEKEIKEYFSIKENKFARDIALNFGPDNVSQSTKVDFTPEEQEKFEQMYLLYRKTNDKDAFSYAFYSNFLLTKPFTYGGIVDRLMGYPENGSHEREYLEMAAEQNSGSYMIGSIAGGGASYAVGSAAMKKVPGVGKLLTKAGEKLSKVPIIGKFGAESLTNILADTTLDTAIDTIPSMVEIAMDGGGAGEVALEGLKRTGINLGANGAFEAVFKVGKGVLGGTVEGGSTISYDKFKKLNIDDQMELFSWMNSEDIYNIVKNSNDSWVVNGYDLITPDNAKDFVKMYTNAAGETAFNLEWPKYGGYEPKTISSIDDLSGKIHVSRDGGDGGYTMGIGKNADGTYANNSQRAIPKSSAEVNTGVFDADLYKSTVDIVTGEGSDISKIGQLVDLGIDDDIAEDLLKDYKNWLTRPEIVGENNISDGIALTGHSIESKYGYYGEAAEWIVGDVKMIGGAGQMNTVYSWGTLKESGIISDIGKAKIY